MARRAAWWKVGVSYWSLSSTESRSAHAHCCPTAKRALSWQRWPSPMRLVARELAGYWVRRRSTKLRSQGHERFIWKVTRALNQPSTSVADLDSQKLPAAPRRTSAATFKWNWHYPRALVATADTFSTSPEQPY